MVVGGFEKVYELNRNFRNEGIDRTHNPEFTMLEFYWAYADVNQMMDFCEAMLRATVLRRWVTRMWVWRARNRFLATVSAADDERSDRGDFAGQGDYDETLWSYLKNTLNTSSFSHLHYDFPKIVSPLSKASPADPSVAERFELFIDGIECAQWLLGAERSGGAISALHRSNAQRERGDEEAMVMDEDYIRALSYGMPPAAGIGIGIDRFVMLLTNKQSIRDVILFPHMRPERKTEDQEPAST